MATLTGWEKARENYKVALAAPVEFAEGGSIDMVRPGDIDYVDEGPGKFDLPVVSLLRCRSCGLFSATRYCSACRASMER